MQLNLPNSSLKWVLVRFALKGDNQHNIRHQPIEGVACTVHASECMQGTTVTLAGYNRNNCGLHATHAQILAPHKLTFCACT